MPMPPWTALLKFEPCQILMTIQSLDGEVVLRARLPMPPQHRRSLLDLLESLALWNGHPLDAVLSAADRSADCFENAVWAEDLLLGPSALVHVVFAAPRGRQLRLVPVGNCRGNGRLA